MPEEVPFRPLFDRAAEEYDVPVGILIEQARAESSFNPHAVGNGGKARGLGQFWEATWGDHGEGPWDNAFIPEYATAAMGRYLSWLRATLHHSSWTLALIAYNWGIGNVLRWLRQGQPIPPSRSMDYARRILERAEGWE